MEESEKSLRGSALGRRDFVKLAAGAGAMTTMLNARTRQREGRPVVDSGQLTFMPTG